MSRLFDREEFVKTAIGACDRGSRQNAHTDKFLLQLLFPEASDLNVRHLIKRKRSTEASLQEELRDNKRKANFYRKKHERIENVLLPAIREQIEDLEDSLLSKDAQDTQDFV